MPTKPQKPIVPGVPDVTVCLDCQQRQVGCHSACRAYLTFSRQNQERREEGLRRQEAETDVILARWRVLRKTVIGGER